MINRTIATSIENAIKHFPIVLLTGPRQIGKSTLLYKCFLEKGFSYISLDDSIELNFAKNDPKTFLQLHPAPLIIDEVQKAPQLFFELEYIINKSRLEKGNIESNGMYILSGSQHRELIDSSIESLPGRICILDMTNLSINEINNKNDIPFNLNDDSIFTRYKRYNINKHQAYSYITRGFFPALYDDKNLNTQQFYSSYLTTYLEKDLKEILNISDEFKFINFLKLLASNTGEELVYDNYSKQVGVVTNTIKTWINSLIKTGIIYLVQPYNENSITKRIVKRPKMYFFDTGLACYLCGIDSKETLEKSFLSGRFFETFIFNEIKKSYINSGLMQDLYYYRDTNQNEVDLILIKDGTLSCIEIKSGQNFNLSSIKAFKNLNNTQLIRGKDAIIATVDSISALNENTLILPISSI